MHVGVHVRVLLSVVFTICAYGVELLVRGGVAVVVGVGVFGFVLLVCLFVLLCVCICVFLLVCFCLLFLFIHAQCVTPAPTEIWLIFYTPILAQFLNQKARFACDY